MKYKDGTSIGCLFQILKKKVRRGTYKRIRYEEPIVFVVPIIGVPVQSFNLSYSITGAISRIFSNIFPIQGVPYSKVHSEPVKVTGKRAINVLLDLLDEEDE
jgi:hypothetical protein